MSEEALERRLVALIAEAEALPRRAHRRLDVPSAEALLTSLQRDLRRADTTPPAPVWRIRPPLEDGVIEVEPLDSEPPPPLAPLRGAENREVRSPTRTRPSRPPGSPRFDPIADAVSTAALHAESRRLDTPPPLPRASDFDIVLSEDDLIDLEPADEEEPRRPTLAQLLDED